MKLLCTDLDRTLLPNGEQPESALARPLLWHMLESRTMLLAYVSGRDLARILDAIDEYHLRIPDVIVADVGSSVYQHSNAGWLKSEQWQSVIAADWNGLVGSDINRHLRCLPGLREQEADRQSEWKTSYYFSLDADREQLRDRVSTCLEALKVNASLIMSDDWEKRVGLLDVLPQNGNKKGAIGFVRKLLHVTPEDTLFAGDSGNDVTALVSDVAGVAVANADTDTRQAIQRQAQLQGTVDSTFQATGGLRLAGNRLLNGNYAAGILEGLIHFRPTWHNDLLNVEWVEKALAQGSSSSAIQSSKSG